MIWKRLQTPWICGGSQFSECYLWGDKRAQQKHGSPLQTKAMHFLLQATSYLEFLSLMQNSALSAGNFKPLRVRFLKNQKVVHTLASFRGDLFLPDFSQTSEYLNSGSSAWLKEKSKENLILQWFSKAICFRGKISADIRLSGTKRNTETGSSAFYYFFSHWF